MNRSIDINTYRKKTQTLSAENFLSKKDIYRKATAGGYDREEKK